MREGVVVVSGGITCCCSCGGAVAPAAGAGTGGLVAITNLKRRRERTQDSADVRRDFMSVFFFFPFVL